ncbi:hypothetical protein U9M48_040501 [Paspalum notatum var. saurae]|uniref:Uncharacterized protein n=1 Tax=Paspalum notatum var. saurae TaxID=547442 RepID=A0AAQ3XFM6_PASNO
MGWLMESFWALKFVSCELLDYIAGRANSLKSIRLIRCAHFWDVSLARLASKCPLLEEIECSYQRLPANLFRYVGTMCPRTSHQVSKNPQAMERLRQSAEASDRDGKPALRLPQPARASRSVGNLGPRGKPR